jgi:hypothetical protein
MRISIASTGMGKRRNKNNKKVDIMENVHFVQ